jgi:hypothetical protein
LRRRQLGLDPLEPADRLVGEPHLGELPRAVVPRADPSRTASPTRPGNVDSSSAAVVAATDLGAGPLEGADVDGRAFLATVEPAARRWRQSIRRGRR